MKAGSEQRCRVVARKFFLLGVVSLGLSGVCCLAQGAAADIDGLAQPKGGHPGKERATGEKGPGVKFDPSPVFVLEGETVTVTATQLEGWPGMQVGFSSQDPTKFTVSPSGSSSTPQIVYISGLAKTGGNGAALVATSVSGGELGRAAVVVVHLEF